MIGTAFDFEAIESALAHPTPEKLKVLATIMRISFRRDTPESDFDVLSSKISQIAQFAWTAGAVNRFAVENGMVCVWLPSEHQHGPYLRPFRLIVSTQ